jgi:hypothetical protein
MIKIKALVESTYPDKTTTTTTTTTYLIILFFIILSLQTTSFKYLQW